MKKKYRTVTSSKLQLSHCQLQQHMLAASNNWRTYNSGWAIVTITCFLHFCHPFKLIKCIHGYEEDIFVWPSFRFSLTTCQRSFFDYSTCPYSYNFSFCQYSAKHFSINLDYFVFLYTSEMLLLFFKLCPFLFLKFLLVRLINIHHNHIDDLTNILNFVVWFQ